MLIIKIIVLLWVITGTLLGVGFCYSDKSDGYFDGLDNFTLIVTVSRGVDIIFKDPKIRLGYVAGYDDGKIDAEREKMRKEETK